MPRLSSFFNFYFVLCLIATTSGLFDLALAAPLQKGAFASSAKKVGLAASAAKKMQPAAVAAPPKKAGAAALKKASLAASVLNKMKLAPKPKVIGALLAPQIAFYKPYTYYAAMAYCQPAAVKSVSCGRNCQANPGFKAVNSGGNGNDVQFWYVGYDTNLKTVIVGHQGTDPSKLMPVITDLRIHLVDPNPKLFPGLPKGIKMHSGFSKEHAKTAQEVLANVRIALKKSGFRRVTIVGHSLGAALALIDSVYLPLFLPPGTSVRMIGYGMPRVGNAEFAAYVDSHVDVTHINNRQDPVATIPGRKMGYRHPKGEKHILPDGVWVDCPGGDNVDKQCATGAVSNVFKGKVPDHSGPYDGVMINCR